MAGTLSTRMSQALEPWFGRDPFVSLRHEMDDLLARFSAENGGLSARPLVPALDLSESNGSLTVRVDLPGIKPGDIDIEVRGNMLRISGERKEEKEEKGKSFHRVERRTGSFLRTVEFPCEIDQDKVKAEYHDGILTVTLPKSEAARSHKIKVKAD